MDAGLDGAGEIASAGNGRFRVVRRLGEGGMGVVYEAFDKERNAPMALKHLRQLGADAILRFKTEFRSLQDLRHRNLVSLGELWEDEGRWFLTMELVVGPDFLTYVRPSRAEPEPTPSIAAAAVMFAGVTEVRPDDVPNTHPLDERRLRASIGQLAQGLTALHDFGMIHRDVKPSNVLVAPDGRVVLVDFGLVMDRQRGAATEGIVGTVFYMAPEQALGGAVGPEADWYGVGVILFEALTGRRPFIGSQLKVLMDKQVKHPPRPSEVAHDIPPDLDELCVDLLRLDPKQRPTGREVLRRLGLEPLPGLGAGTISTAGGGPPFVGRDAELDVLGEAYDDARRGGAVCLLVYGESGLGKTALVRQFTNRRASDAVVVYGRCYERELLPYKGVDGVIDDLARTLAGLPPEEVEPLLPPHAALLGQVFPVLRKIELIASMSPPELDGFDPLELRSRVFSGFREMVRRLSARGSVVFVVDDLEWADADGLALLAEIVRPPDAPSILLLGTVNVESADAMPADPAKALPGGARRLELGPLAPHEARALATVLVAENQVDAETIANEAGGHPLFIHELVHHAAATGAPAHRLRLEEALAARVALLEPDVRRLLEIVAVAGKPTAQDVIARAVALPAGELSKNIAFLRMAHLIRTKGARGSDPVECFHDRIREATVARIEPDIARQHHERLALSLESEPHADLESLCTHWQGAGRADRAGRYAERAAAQADAALAFQRAVRLYRLALELLDPDPAERRTLLCRLGEALSNAGRGREAAEAYLASVAVEGGMAPPRADLLDLRSRAAEGLLHSGHLDEAMEALREVLRSVGMTLPATPRRALASLLLKRAQRKLRGLAFRERDVGQIAHEVLSRIDTCWRAATGLLPVDTIRGLDFQTRHLLLALDAGEPYRIARALALEAASQATRGNVARADVDKLIASATALATRVDNPHATGLVVMIDGVARHLQGEWKESLALCERGEAQLRDRCTGVSWEIGTCRRFSVASLHYLGRLHELRARGELYLRDAVDRGDLYAATNVRSGRSNVAWLGAGDVDRAREWAGDAMRLWTQRGFHTQHFYAMQTEAQVELYEGRPDAAWRGLEASWRALETSLLLRVQLIRVEASYLRAGVALAAGRGGAGTARALRVAEHAAGRMEKERVGWADALAQVVRANIAMRRGDGDGAAKLLSTAITGFDGSNMRMHAALARLRLGQLLQGDEGRDLIAAASEWGSVERVSDIDRLCAAIMP